MKKVKSIHEEHGQLAIPVMQGMLQARAEELYKLPERFKVLPNNGPSVTIMDTKTGKTVGVGLCDYHGALKVLEAFF